LKPGAGVPTGSPAICRASFHHRAASNPTTSPAAKTPSTWTAENAPTHPTALGSPFPSRPCQTTKAAGAARTALRASVDQSAGAECSCPKQRQLGLRPRARLAPIATAKSNSNKSTPTAPHQAVVVGTKAAATASSASGSKIPSGAARAAGTPKSTTACRVPARSASFATPATAKTMASNNLAHRMAASMTKLSLRQSTRSSLGESVYLKRRCALPSSGPGLRRTPLHSPPGCRPGPSLLDAPSPSPRHHTPDVSEGGV
jgi:hypothetical protein